MCLSVRERERERRGGEWVWSRVRLDEELGGGAWAETKELLHLCLLLQILFVSCGHHRGGGWSHCCLCDQRVGLGLGRAPAKKVSWWQHERSWNWFSDKKPYIISTWLAAHRRLQLRLLYSSIHSFIQLGTTMGWRSPCVQYQNYMKSTRPIPVLCAGKISIVTWPSCWATTKQNV